ncbi:MAG: hypothetical protein IJH13_00820 [Bacilli bacterium]|nr:hypothetical protein [Bacilli bacterium]
MKKVFSIRNGFLMLVVVLIGVLSLNIKEAKAAGTVTWVGPSSITIRETIRNTANPIVASMKYTLVEYSSNNDVATATINYTASDTPTNYQITKSTTMNLSSLTFTKPGDYEYYILQGSLEAGEGKILNNYFIPSSDSAFYDVTISVRNVVDANNTPTGNYTVSLILRRLVYNEQTEEYEYDEEKVSPVSGVLYADHYLETNPNRFGHIELSKTVKGIGADTTKYFPFTINIDNDSGLVQDETTEGAVPNIIDSSGWVYPISGIDATVTYNGNTITNPTTITDGTPTTIYLKHGQTATIGQVTSEGNTFDVIPGGYCGEETPDIDPDPDHKKYDFSTTPSVKKLAAVDGKTCYGSYFTIEESPGDYTPAFSVNGGSSTSGYYVSATGLYNMNTDSNTVTVDFYNTKEMSPVTGLIFTILPYVILAGIGVGGTLLVMHLKKEERKVKE